MAKQGNLKTSKIFTSLPKALPPVTAVTFLSPPRSPVTARANSVRGFSGPMISLIPKEARRKARSASFDAREPTSPKVSCMGQVKKKKKKKKEKETKPEENALVCFPKAIMKLLINVKQQSIKSYTGDESPRRPAVAEKAPSLGHIKQFTSGRGALHRFDWKAHDIAAIEDGKNGCADDHKRDEDTEQVIVAAYSKDAMVGGEIVLHPRKEVNLWKRRTMAPPKPLKL